MERSQNDNQSSLLLLTKDVEDQEKRIVENTGSIATTTSRVGEAEMSISENKAAVEDNTAAINLLSMEGNFYTFKFRDIFI